MSACHISRLTQIVLCGFWQPRRYVLCSQKHDHSYRKKGHVGHGPLVACRSMQCKLCMCLRIFHFVGHNSIPHCRPAEGFQSGAMMAVFRALCEHATLVALVTRWASKVQYSLQCLPRRFLFKLWCDLATRWSLQACHSLQYFSYHFFPILWQ